jgi:2-dehydro-3-deoxyphosphooctonate aldolase (KDO 8-P synthase)
MFFLIAGPCAIEDAETLHEVAAAVRSLTETRGIRFILKSSYEKANRTRLGSFTGIGREAALELLRDAGRACQVPVLTDVHETADCALAAQYADYLQIPAFLCRQTSLLLAAGATGKGVNIKKGQFMAPEGMQFAVEKVRSAGPGEVWVTERGTTFGYERLVADMTGIPAMRAFAPVVMDCTHSVQRPNQPSGITGGDASMIATMALCGLAAGADGLFIEVHPEPARAQSDAGSMLRLDLLEPLLDRAVRVWEAVHT